MKGHRNLVTRMLMISSMIFLIALDILWLKSSCEKAYADFKKEGSAILRYTIADLRDSLFVKMEKPFSPDSIDNDRDILFREDSSDFKVDGPDSAKILSERKFIVSRGIRIDSPGALPRSHSAPRTKPDDHRTFIVHLGPDTLDAAILSKRLDKNLKAVGLFTPFQIERIKRGREALWPGEFDNRPDLPPILYSDTLVAGPASFIGPFNDYVAVFSNVRSTILRTIAPQIVLSVLLILVVLASFVIIYKSLRAQQRLNDLKNDFISNITHELKTPLATVSVALEALKDFHALENPERTREYLNIAQYEISRLSLMTDKVLKASAFETQGVAYVPENVNLHSVIQQVLSSLKLVFEKSNLQVAYTPEGRNFDLKGSELHLTNVVYNLLDNALKYGNGQRKIDLVLTATDEHLDFSVRDYGIGIAKEYQKKIFEKFFRVPTGDVHNVKGYGLGLNYVAGVIQKHGGTINVESEIGKGSLFKIRLPK